MSRMYIMFICCLQCFQSSWLSITFSLPLAQICQADSLSQVKPSRRHCWEKTSPPPHPAHTHTHAHPWITNPHLTTATSPASTPGIPVILPCLLRDFRDHVTHRSGAFPPTTRNSGGEGEGHTLAPAQLSTTPPSAQTSGWSSLFMTFSS